MALRTFVRAAVAFVWGSLVLAACSPSSPLVGSNPATKTRIAQPQSASTWKNLYVAVCCAVSSQVDVYAPNGPTLLRTIGKIGSNPEVLAFDPTGDLYVGSEIKDISVVAPGATKPLRKIRKGARSVSGIAFDATHKVLYASAEIVHGGGFVTAYDSVGKPLYRIQHGIHHPNGIAVDDAGNLYVADGDRSSVSVYAPGSKNTLRVIKKGVKVAGALAFDALGNLYVAAEGGHISVYAPNSTKVLRTIKEGLELPTYLAFDGAGNLYVEDEIDGIVVYAPGGSSPIRTITSGNEEPRCMAVATDGTLYVAYQNKSGSRNVILAYAPGTSTVIGTIMLRGFNEANALVIGP